MEPSEHESKAVVVTWEELESLRKRAEEYLDLARRAKADFLNYQDRIKREREEWRRSAVERIALEFLAAMDGLHDSLAALDGVKDPSKILEGLRVIEKEILRILAKVDIRPIEALKKPFDPLYHEAVGTVESDAVSEDCVIEEVRRGYTLEGKVLRPSLVKVVTRTLEKEG